MVFIFRSTSEANGKAALVQREISALKQQEQEILRQAEQVKQAMTPEQLQSLKSAHELVNRKRFSWSRLFADLEAVLPGGVRVSRIAVRQVRTQGGRTIAGSSGDSGQTVVLPHRVGIQTYQLLAYLGRRVV